MKKVILACAVIFGSLAAHADVEYGVFQGTDQNGLTCEIEVLVKWYAHNEKHPLNERITVRVDGLHWDLAHPAVVVESDSKVRFDHSYFHHAEATREGAEYLRVNIDHDSEPHAPTSYTLFQDNYRDSTKSRKVVCSELVKIGDVQ